MSESTSSDGPISDLSSDESSSEESVNDLTHDIATQDCSVCPLVPGSNNLEIKLVQFRMESRLSKTTLNKLLTILREEDLDLPSTMQQLERSGRKVHRKPQDSWKSHNWKYSSKCPMRCIPILLEGCLTFPWNGTLKHSLQAKNLVIWSEKVPTMARHMVSEWEPRHSNSHCKTNSMLMTLFEIRWANDWEILWQAFFKCRRCCAYPCGTTLRSIPILEAILPHTNLYEY